jgi:hypothetical protein
MSSARSRNAPQEGLPRVPARTSPFFTVGGAQERLGQARIQPLWSVIAEDRA